MGARGCSCAPRGTSLTSPPTLPSSSTCRTLSRHRRRGRTLGTALCCTWAAARYWAGRAGKRLSWHQVGSRQSVVPAPTVPPLPPQATGDYMGVSLRNQKVHWVYRLGPSGPASLSVDQSIGEQFAAVSVHRWSPRGARPSSCWARPLLTPPLCPQDPPVWPYVCHRGEPHGPRDQGGHSGPWGRRSAQPAA